MYKALDSFTTKDYDVRRGEILAEDFTTQDEIQEFLNIGYIVEFNGSLDITSNGTYDVTEYEQAVVNVSGGSSSDVDWSAIGYDAPPSSIINDFNYSKNIYDNWNSSVSDLSRKFAYNSNLKYMPLVDTSSATKMEAMFQNANQLTTTPLLDTSNVTVMNNMFTYCSKLTDESLNNILLMCINATSYTGTKTLQQLGFSNSYQTASRIESLPNYQEFLDAGWTIGY